MSIIPASLTALFVDLEKVPFQPLAEYDVYKGILQQFPETSGTLLMQERAELIAFHVSESDDYKNNWGKFYGPFMTWEDGDGNYTEQPPLESITQEVIHYWEQRAEEAKHPLLKARYAGLVHEFQYSISGKNSDHKFTRTHVEALINLIDSSLFKEPVYSKRKINRTLQIALSLNDSPLITLAINAMLELENRIGVNEFPGLWGFSFDWLINGKKSLLDDTKELQVVEKLEERMNSLVLSNTNGTEGAVTRLAEYYNRKKQPTDHNGVSFVSFTCAR